MRSALICASLAVLVAGLAGCGSGGSDTTTGPGAVASVTAPDSGASPGGPPSSTRTGTTPARPASAFAARADAVCARYQASRRQILSRLQGLFRPRPGSRGGGYRGGGAPGGASRVADAYRQLVDSGRRELEELRGLPEPANQSARIHAYFTSVESTLDALDKVAAGLASPGSGALQTAGRDVRATAVQTHRLAGELGFRTCGELR